MMAHAMTVVKGRLTAYAIAALTVQIVASEPSGLALVYQDLTASKPSRNSEVHELLNVFFGDGLS